MGLIKSESNKKTMGFWGIKPFESDNAFDLLEEMQRQGEAELLGVLTTSQKDPFSGCPEAIAAAEVVAAWLGRPIAETPDDPSDLGYDNLPPEVVAFVKSQEKKKPSNRLVNLAIDAVEGILEYRSFGTDWPRPGCNEKWQILMKDLLARLGPRSRQNRKKTVQ